MGLFFYFYFVGWRGSAHERWFLSSCQCGCLPLLTPTATIRVSCVLFFSFLWLGLLFFKLFLLISKRTWVLNFGMLLLMLWMWEMILRFNHALVSQNPHSCSSFLTSYYFLSNQTLTRHLPTRYYYYYYLVGISQFTTRKATEGNALGLVIWVWNSYIYLIT